MTATKVEWSSLEITDISDELSHTSIDKQLVDNFLRKILKENIKQSLDYLLNEIINISKSDIAAICNIDNAYIKILAISNKEINNAVIFHNVNRGNMLCRGILRKMIIISNDMENDPRKTNLPKDHFKLHKFLGIPLICDDVCVGQIVMANKANPYQVEDIVKLQGIIYLTGLLLESMRYKKNYTLIDMLGTNSDIQHTKDNFVAIISHEIRTPLTGILGAMTMIPQLGNLNDKQLKHMDIATSCSIQLLDIINGILDYSRLSSKTLSIQHEPFELMEAVNRAISIVESKAISKGLELQKKIDENLPKSIVGDKKRLVQILVNVLSNAIKFTDKGYIKLEMFGKNNPNASEWCIIFRIKDTGIGISDEDQKAIFQAFARLEHKTAYNKTDGIGLGLAISKQLVELMGGEITAQSDGLYKGSTFEFNIIVDESIDVNSYKDLLTGKIALTVDDKMENLSILDDMLQKWNIKNIMCTNAEQALRYIKRGEYFDLAIIDIYMPYMSGIELAQQLRKVKSSLPLIGISSVEEQGKEWFDQYLQKPYNQTRILKCIISCLKNPKSDTSILSIDNVKKKRENIKILIAEDDINTQFMVKEFIIACRIPPDNIKIASDGQEAIDMCRLYDFDICLMDIKMPIVNGLDASRYIKANVPHPAIIAMSAGVLDSDKNTYLQAGMDGYLGKPFTISDLDNILNRFCE